MDGDHRMKQHEQLMAPSGNSTASGHVTDQFNSNMQPHGMRGEGNSTGISQAPYRSQISYDYGFTGGSFHGGSLQASDVMAYNSDFPRAHGTPSHQSGQQRRHAPQEQQHQHYPSLAQYESAMLYGFGHHGPTQGGGGPAFEVAPPYSSRQSAAIEALSNQFAVPQYFTPEETTPPGAPGLSPYLNPHLSYNHPGPMPRPSNSTQPFPTTMADFGAIGPCASNRLDAQPLNQSTESGQQHPEQDFSCLDQAYAQYQRALRNTFDHARAGRLLDASRSLLEISEWLVTNAQDLGILRDDHDRYQDSLQLWNNFNLCWLAVCQKQKDLTQDFVATGHQSIQASLLSRERMQSMGKDLIQLCDQLEQYGLVDYQMGIWEEEILCVLGQCLDLIESRPDLLHIHAIPEPVTAAPRP